MSSSRWSRLVGDPILMRRVNGWAAVVSVVLIPISIWLGWVNSVAYVSALSIWALVAAHWSGWQSANTEAQLRDDIDTPE